MKENYNKFVDEKVANLITILNKIKAIIEKNTTSVAWSRFESKEEVISKLDNHIERIQSHKFNKMWDLVILFAPTGSLQEISISNGWEDVYLVLASEFDTAIKELKHIL